MSPLSPLDVRGMDTADDAGVDPAALALARRGRELIGAPEPPPPELTRGVAFAYRPMASARDAAAPGMPVSPKDLALGPGAAWLSLSLSHTAGPRHLGLATRSSSPSLSGPAVDALLAYSLGAGAGSGGATAAEAATAVVIGALATDAAAAEGRAPSAATWDEATWTALGATDGIRDVVVKPPAGTPQPSPPPLPRGEAPSLEHPTRGCRGISGGRLPRSGDAAASAAPVATRADPPLAARPSRAALSRLARAVLAATGPGAPPGLPAAFVSSDPEAAVRLCCRLLRAARADETAGGTGAADGVAGAAPSLLEAAGAALLGRLPVAAGEGGGADGAGEAALAAVARALCPPAPAAPTDAAGPAGLVLAAVATRSLPLGGLEPARGEDGGAALRLSRERRLCAVRAAAHLALDNLLGVGGGEGSGGGWGGGAAEAGAEARKAARAARLARAGPAAAGEAATSLLGPPGTLRVRLLGAVPPDGRGAGGGGGGGGGASPLTSTERRRRGGACRLRCSSPTLPPGAPTTERTVDRRPSAFGSAAPTGQRGFLGPRAGGTATP